MGRMAAMVGMVVVMWLGVTAVQGEVENAGISGSAEPRSESQVVIQIYGRFCEYHRSDVEAALHGFDDIKSIEFLNNHGTVLVQYQSGQGTPPEAYADAVSRALAMGWNCRAEVDRGRRHGG